VLSLRPTMNQMISLNTTFRRFLAFFLHKSKQKSKFSTLLTK
jgi:hypothetical protein